MKTRSYQSGLTFEKYDRDHIAIYFNETTKEVPSTVDGGTAQVEYEYDTVLVAANEPSADAFTAALMANGIAKLDAQAIAAGIIFASIQKGQLEGDELAAAKEMVCAKISAYDSLDAVNAFTYDGTKMWLDKDTRAGLQLRLNAEQAAGHEVTTLWYGTQSFSLAVSDAMQMLTALELYASACFDKTEEHKAAVNAKRTVNTVLAYDYTQGYPEKLVF